MSGAVMFVVFVAALVVAARFCLRGEHRPPIAPDDEPYARSGDPTHPPAGTTSRMTEELHGLAERSLHRDRRSHRVERGSLNDL